MCSSIRFLCELNARSYNFYLLPRFAFLLLTAFATNFSKRTLSLHRIWKRNFESNLSVSFSLIRDISSSSRSPRIHVRLDGCKKKGLRVEFEFAEPNRGRGHEVAKGGKYLEYRSVMCRRDGMVRYERESREAAHKPSLPPPLPHCPLNFTRVFT